MQLLQLLLAPFLLRLTLFHRHRHRAAGAYCAHAHVRNQLFSHGLARDSRHCGGLKATCTGETAALYTGACAAAHIAGDTSALAKEVLTQAKSQSSRSGKCGCA